MNKQGSILIIANGESILNNDYGEFVDKHPLVARINNYQITTSLDQVRECLNI